MSDEPAMKLAMVRPRTYSVRVSPRELMTTGGVGSVAIALLAKLGPADFSFEHVGIGDLPLYNQDDDSHPSEPVKRLKSEVAGAQGLLFISLRYWTDNLVAVVNKEFSTTRISSSGC